ncbi:Crp/Fnr family transcriptional regulator, partial [Candidatus Peribacteria bacterium]|nr:Crp/Fnr family transcriptional regulator [Candidatus Peribacteria bacterium]
MPRPHKWYCEKVELFAGLTEAEMQEIIPGILHEEYKKGQLIYAPHDRMRCTCILKDGEVTLYTLVEGKRVILDILNPGAVFGAFGTQETERQMYAEASQNSAICKLPHNFFLKLMQHKPQIAMRAFSILSKRIAQYQLQVQLLSGLAARERILATIRLLNAKEEQNILPPILRRPISITHEKLANMTGLTRETVTKQLNQLIEENLVQVHRRH